MTAPRVLVAGIGNIFLGDDAFGVEVVRGLAQRPLPAGVHVVDFGIRGIDLLYALLDPHDAVILVDTTRRGGEAGTLYVIEPDAGESSPDVDLFEAHSMDPAKVIRLARSMGGALGHILIVGCEPADEQTSEAIGMSPPVQRAVGEAIQMVEDLVTDALQVRPCEGR